MGEFPSKANQFSSDRQPEKNGRPPGKSFKTILDALLDLEASDEDLNDEDIKKMFPEGKVTNREIFMARMLITAKKAPESKSAERLMNRVEGMPKQSIEYSGEMNFNSDPFKQVRDNTDSNTEKKE